MKNVTFCYITKSDIFHLNFRFSQNRLFQIFKIIFFDKKNVGIDSDFFSWLDMNMYFAIKPSVVLLDQFHKLRHVLTKVTTYTTFFLESSSYFFFSCRTAARNWGNLEAIEEIFGRRRRPIWEEIEEILGFVC